MSAHERARIEQETCEQSSNSEWFQMRSKRITDSKCGRILCQVKKSISLSRECLYPKTIDSTTKTNSTWGRRFESVAVDNIELIKKCEVLYVNKCGFVIHP